MNVVDSSGWLEYFADGPNAGRFASPIQNTRELIVPTLSLYEVFKRVFQQRSETGDVYYICADENGAVCSKRSPCLLNLTSVRERFLGGGARR